MLQDLTKIQAFLAHVHPYDSLTEAELAALAGRVERVEIAAGDTIYALGETLRGVYVIAAGEVAIADETGAQISHLGVRNSFGERGLARDGLAVTTATGASDAELLVVPAEVYHELIEAHPAIAKFFDRSRGSDVRKTDLATARISELMTKQVLGITADATIERAAHLMHSKRVSSLAVMEGGRLAGILTVRDMTRVVADGLASDDPVSDLMARDPITLSPDALGSDVLHTMLERKIGHLPITDKGALVGIVTQTDLIRFQALSSAQLVHDIVYAKTPAEIALVTKRLPELLAQLVGAGNPHEVVTRLITDIADAATRRLLSLAEDSLGPPPVPYLWLACGSQGRQEQTGVSDQDNCLIIDDAMTPGMDAYFKALAEFVCDGLNEAGYIYCPGDMMATADRWRQPLRVWKSYFQKWIAKPDNEAQMLASVMFDLRGIGGEQSLFEDLQGATLKAASANSIFVTHMIANSLKHTPPLGMFRGFATIKSGEHKNQLDLKHNGVVPVVDLGRVYALQAQLTAVNTRARLEAAKESGVISTSGAADLLDAYDLIAESRLQHQARQVRAGEKPDNYMSPTSLSDFERSHLRDAFVVIRTMQSAVGSGRGAVT
ncbi:putative nucleotidyltransferase substrate binding domain-containing protein [Dinoroseobacter sp. S76]|uniref:putative nucleotidyltransferase substrate binding domain-containing protein n=1 Tax=Dinoroseobacter sp. S76 TaxID=3415124 RepID=UPI003C7BF0FB